MMVFLLLSLPAFSVVVLGWIAVRMQLVAAGALDALGAFSFHFALPALLLRLIAAEPLHRLFNPVFYGGYLASGSRLFGGVFAASYLLDSQGRASAGAHATTATVGNLGFLGLPLLLAFFGDRAAGPLAMALMAEVMVLLSLGSTIMSASGGRRVGAARIMIPGVVLSPVVGAVLLGVGLATTGLSVPGPLDHSLAFLGGAAGPTALFTVGGTMAIRRIDGAAIYATLGITMGKLIAYPALVWCVLSRLPQIEPF